MKKVIKVSIGNTAFTLEEEAYTIMNNYLSSLSAHYSNKPNGQEIIDGIEERIAELLLERCGENKIISAPMAQQVIDILGRPEVIDRESGEDESSYSRTSAGGNSTGGKKLFRDPYNRILGGVCSGLAAYFDRDASLFRILFIVCTLLFSIPSMGIGGGFFILGYLLMWIILPSAKTVDQRCRMKGESNTIDNIEKSIKDGSKDIEDRMREVRDNNPNFWRTFGRVISIFIGAIFTIIGITGVVACVSLFFGIKVWGMTLPMMAFDFYSMAVGSTVSLSIWMRILIGLTIFLPFVGFLYSGIQMMFDFKSPKWRPGLIIFIIWIISVIGCSTIGITSSFGLWDNEEMSMTKDVTLQKDTVYVEFAGVKEMKDNQIWVDADRDEYNLVYLSGDSHSAKEVIAYPFFEIRRGYDQPYIKSYSTLFTEMMSFDEIKEANKLEFYEFDGETLTLYPVKYNQDEHMKEVGRKIKLCVDDNVVVIVKEPVYHEFNNSFEYTDFKFSGIKSIDKRIKKHIEID